MRSVWSLRAALEMRGGHGLLFGVDADDVAGGAEVDGGEGEDAGAAAEVEHGVAGLHAVLQRLQAHARRRVLAGAEGHAGVEADDDLAALAACSRARRGG